MAVHGCPMSRISKYEFPFCQSRKTSSPLTAVKERTKNKTVTFPHENILNLHILLQVVCHSFASLVSDTFLSLAPKNHISQASLASGSGNERQCWETEGQKRGRSQGISPFLSALIGISSVAQITPGSLIDPAPAGQPPVF